MNKFLDVCSKSSIQRFIELWLSLKETPYWFHQTLTLGEQIEDFGVAKRILERLFDSLEVEMGKQYDMGAIYIMAHQGKGRVHFHVVFFFHGIPAETPENLAAILRREVWKRWKKLNPGLNPKGNLLTIQTKASGLWYLAEHLTVGKTAKEKGKPSWYGLRNKRLIEANALPVTKMQVQREFDFYFPVRKPVARPVATEPKGFICDVRTLDYMKAHVESQGRYDWETFKRARTGKRGKVSDVSFISFLNRQSVTPGSADGNTL